MSDKSPAPAPRRTHRPGETAISGAAAGIFAVLISYPFDLIKTTLHFEVVKHQGQRSARQIVQRIFARGGALSFYRGIDQLIPEAALKALMRFLVFTEFQHYYKRIILHDENAHLNITHNLFCGAIAGVVEGFVVTQPFERGKTLRANLESPWAIYGEAFRKGGLSGLRSLYVGGLPTLGRQIGNQAFSFTIFYELKSRALKDNDKKELTTWQSLLFGFLGGCGGAFVTNPFDVVKSLAQKQTSTIRSTSQLFASVYNTSGLRGFYVGMLPRVGRMGIDRACSFFAFEYLMSWFKQMHAVKLASATTR